MKPRSIAISQSNYIPWKGYFDNIAQVDEFILYDTVQYTKRDWRNRNKIKTPQGLKWLTIPVQVKGKFTQLIQETLVSDQNWVEEHLRLIKLNYSNAECFDEIFPWLESVYNSGRYETISEINHHFLINICKFLGIETRIRMSSDYKVKEQDKTRKLIEICKLAEAEIYFSSPAAKNYMVESLFEEEGIELRYYTYEGYKEYEQLHGDFEHGVSIIDLLLNKGTEAPKYLKFIS